MLKSRKQNDKHALFTCFSKTNRHNLSRARTLLSQDVIDFPAHFFSFIQKRARAREKEKETKRFFFHPSKCQRRRGLSRIC